MVKHILFNITLRLKYFAFRSTTVFQLKYSHSMLHCHFDADTTPLHCKCPTMSINFLFVLLFGKHKWIISGNRVLRRAYQWIDIVRSTDPPTGRQSRRPGGRRQTASDCVDVGWLYRRPKPHRRSWPCPVQAQCRLRRTLRRFYDRERRQRRWWRWRRRRRQQRGAISA